MPRPAVIHCTAPLVSSPPVAQVVFVQHLAFDHVGDRLEAAVGMGRETRDVIVSLVGIELVQHQKGVQWPLRVQHPGQADTGTVGCPLADQDLSNLTLVHANLHMPAADSLSGASALIAAFACSLPRRGQDQRQSRKQAQEFDRSPLSCSKLTPAFSTSCAQYLLE